MLYLLVEPGYLHPLSSIGCRDLEICTPLPLHSVYQRYVPVTLAGRLFIRSLPVGSLFLDPIPLQHWSWGAVCLEEVFADAPDWNDDVSPTVCLFVLTSNASVFIQRFNLTAHTSHTNIFSLCSPKACHQTRWIRKKQRRRTQHQQQYRRHLHPMNTTPTAVPALSASSRARAPSFPGGGNTS